MRIGWARHVAHASEMRSSYKILVGKPQRKRQLERPRRRWEDNIRPDIREIGREGGNWMHLALERDQWRAVVNTVMNLGIT
jgi:hypothetical protein